MVILYESDPNDGPLSADEKGMLRALHRGGRFSVDTHGERALVRRGLVTLGDWQLGMLVFHDMPFLTEHGARIAARLVAEETNERRRFPRGFAVIQGGLA